MYPFLAGVELFRRFMWALLRVEWEHVKYSPAISIMSDSKDTKTLEDGIDSSNSLLLPRVMQPVTYHIVDDFKKVEDCGNTMFDYEEDDDVETKTATSVLTEVLFLLLFVIGIASFAYISGIHSSK